MLYLMAVIPLILSLLLCGADAETCDDVVQATSLLQVELARRPVHDSEKPVFDSAYKEYVAGDGVKITPAVPFPKIKKIPRQFFMTGKPNNYTELADHLHKNVLHTKALNEGLNFKYLGDHACEMYIQRHFDQDLWFDYASERKGSYRGDLCRTAVLLREGGFYADIDLEMLSPFLHLVDTTTHFMSAIDYEHHVYNAIIGVVPDSPVMKQHLAELRKWFRLRREQRIKEPKEKMSTQKEEAHVLCAYEGSCDQEEEWRDPERPDEEPHVPIGPVTLRAALKTVMRESCPETNLDELILSEDIGWRCGPYNLVMYPERRCKTDEGIDCPSGPRDSNENLQYGIVGSSKRFIAWSRHIGCGYEWSCGSSRSALKEPSKYK